MIDKSNHIIVGTHKKYLVDCDFHLSPRCKHKYYRFWIDIERGRKRNNGKDICLSCSRMLKAKDRRQYRFDDTFFSVIDSEMKAYVLGVIAGDGYIRDDNLIAVELHKDDREVLEYIASLFYPRLVIKPRKGKNTCYLRFFSARAASDLLRLLGLRHAGKKSHAIAMPLLDEKLIWHFVRGLFDSDGTVRDVEKTGGLQVSISTRSKKMRTDLARLTGKRLAKSETRSITWCGDQALKVLDKIYEDATVFLQRKYDRYCQWLLHYEKRLSRILTPDFLRERYIIGNLRMVDIAAEVGCHAETVSKYIRKAGLRKAS